jgi:FtsH-binding integral membrane protein
MDLNREERPMERVAGDVVLAQGFMTKVYMWMTVGLVATAAMAYYVSTSASALRLLFGHGMIPIIVLAVVELGLVMFLSAKVMTLSPTVASALFFGYALLNGVTLAPIFLVYTGESVVTAFVASAAMFGGMSLYAVVTKRDLSTWGDFLKMGLWGILIALLVNMFVRSSKADLVISIIAVIVFTGLTAYDTFKLRALAAQGGLGDDTRDSLAVLGALQLYLDFINIFIHLLRIFGKRRN